MALAKKSGGVESDTSSRTSSKTTSEMPSQVPSARPIFGVRDSMSASFVSPPMPRTRYSALAAQSPIPKSWSKSFAAQLGKRGAEHVLPNPKSDMASFQMDGHQSVVMS